MTSRRWRAANPEEYRKRNRESARRWRAANLEAAREEARRRRAANPENVRTIERRYRATHPHNGVPPEEWAALWAVQDGLCYLCGEPLPEDRRQAVVDHDHRCCPPERSCRWCRRGLAHSRCNVAIGMAGDDPARLRRIAANLRAAQRRIKPLLPAQPVLFTMRAEPPAPPRRPNPNGHREDPDPGQWEAMTLW